MKKRIFNGHQITIGLVLLISLVSIVGALAYKHILSSQKTIIQSHMKQEVSGSFTMKQPEVVEEMGKVDRISDTEQYESKKSGNESRPGIAEVSYDNNRKVGNDTSQLNKYNVATLQE